MNLGSLSNGWIFIDKPKGITSFDVIRKIRNFTKIKKIGHSGTLDPFATGVLALAFGEATKTIQFLSSIKEYDFEVDEKKTKAEFSRLAPMSPGGSDSRLAIFKFNSFVNPGSIAKLNIKINKESRGTWVPLRSLSQSDQGLWALYTINEENTVVRDLVEIVYFEDQYAFVNGTIKDGDLIVLGGATKIIPGKKID